MITEGNDRSETRPGEFATTHWSVVLLAGDAASPAAGDALESLCRTYWYPLYAFVRRQGHSAADAQDLTQEFFARFLQREYFKLADRNRGRFRTFLLCSLRRFLTNEWEKARTEKRAGGRPLLSIDEQSAEGRYLAEPVDGLTPERIYEKRWAVTLLEKVMASLRARHAIEGKGDLFDALKPYVWGDTLTEGYGAIAGRLGLSEGALRVAAHRLRESFRELLRAEVASTVESQAEIDEELRHLIAVLRD